MNSTSSTSSLLMSRPKSRTQLKTLTYAEKLAALREVEKGVKSKSQIAKDFGIPPTTLSTYIKNKEKILSIASNKNDMMRKRAKRPENPDIEECVLKWYKQIQSEQTSPTGTVIRAKAEEFAAQLGKDKFKASSGWLEGFKKRNGISFRTVKEETEDRDVDLWKSDLLNLIRETCSSDIFSVAETGLFYKCTPDNMSVFKEERCSGGEFNEERVTLLIGANMDGTEKLPLLMVGKYTNPKGFKNAQIQVEYKADKNAWMTSEIFERWLLELDRIFREQNRTVLLFVSNCTAHSTIPPMANVQVFFLLNTPSIQPMDQGIIKEFKHHYRRLVVENFLSKTLPEKNGQVKMNILEAGRMCERAWERVSANTIVDCFRKAGFVKDESDVVDVKPLVCNWENLSEEEAARFENFVNFDENVETFGVVTDEDILSEVSSRKIKKTSDEDEGKSIPTGVEVLGHLQEVRRFIEAQANAPSYLFHALDSLQHYTLSCAVNSNEQIDISEFFNK